MVCGRFVYYTGTSLSRIKKLCRKNATEFCSVYTFRRPFAVRFHFAVIFERRHDLELEHIQLVQTVDARFVFGVLDLAGADIAIELGIGKAEVFFVCFARKPVDRRLFNQVFRKAERAAERFDLCNSQT